MGFKSGSGRMAPQVRSDDRAKHQQRDLDLGIVRSPPQQSIRPSRTWHMLRDGARSLALTSILVQSGPRRLILMHTFLPSRSRPASTRAAGRDGRLRSAARAERSGSVALLPRVALQLLAAFPQVTPDRLHVVGKDHGRQGYQVAGLLPLHNDVILPHGLLHGLQGCPNHNTETKMRRFL